jgi:hypothetical protein
MRNLYSVYFLLLSSIAWFNARPVAAASAAKEVEPFLVAGNLAAGRAAMLERLAANQADDEAQYAVGVIDVLQAVENLAQNLHRYGLKQTNFRLPFARLPVPENPHPERLTYEKWRAVLQQVIDDLEAAAQSLADVDDEQVKLKLPVGLMRLDLDGDGEARDDETFWKVFTAVAWRAAKLDVDQQRFEIGFDKADVHWMIGYTHLLRAMAEAWLAYDTGDFFALTAPVLFDGAAPPATPLGRGELYGFVAHEIVDAVAALHLIRFDVVEPQRMAAAHEHLLSMIAESRQVWNFATAETDNDREWIPNANQTSLTPLTVNQALIDAWAKFLDEAEAVLQGDKLLPHWRVGGDGGINLKRVFTEPRQFDLVLWIQGAAALPYVEEGPKVTGATARTLTQTFEGRFVVFAIWFQ